MADASESYEQWQRAFAIRRLRIGLWIGVAGWGSYLAVDAAVQGWGSPPVILRLSAVAILIAALLLQRSALLRRHFDATFVVTLCALTFTTLATPVGAREAAGADASTFVFQSARFGIALVFVAAAALVPVRLHAHLVFQALTVAFFAYYHATTFAALEFATHLVPALLGLFWVCFVCDFSIVLYSRLQRSEFEARRELEQLAQERREQLDSLEGIGITATSADPDEQARAALDALIAVVGVERAWLYLLDPEGRQSFRLGRSATGEDLGAPADADSAALELPLRMRDRRIGAIRLAGNADAGAPAAQDPFLRALANHVAIALETLRTTEELRAARDQALAADRAKDGFLQTMSHELRTPLNAMIGYSEMLQEELEDAGNAELAADAGRVRTAAGRLLGVIGDILELTDLEAEAPKASSFPVAELVAELDDALRPAAEQSRNRLEFVVAEDVGTMRSDRVRLSTVLTKLLENACKFTRAGKIVCEVGRTRLGQGDAIRFRIRDTGIGMSEEQLAKCFEPFYQADPSSTREYEGAGLGLTTARRLCEVLGGELRVRSAPGEGSSFELTLPAA